MILIPHKRMAIPVSILLAIFCVFPPNAMAVGGGDSIKVTPAVRSYAERTVKPALDSSTKKDELSLLLKVCEVLRDPAVGIGVNAFDPGTYMVYDALEKWKLGFFAACRLTHEQKRILKERRAVFMQNDAADVFFAPPSDEIIRTRAAFGCSHYARAFMAVVKALGLIEDPRDMRYVISCKADDYDRALDKKDGNMTINGHQFVMIKIAEDWIAIDTSKGEYVALPQDFNPDSLAAGGNIPVVFPAYKDIVFLLRKVGKDYEDDCGDVCRKALMNIYRSGDPQRSDFLWEAFRGTTGSSVITD